MANKEEVFAALDRVNAEAAPIAGIIHAAGVVRDGILLSQSWEDFEEVLKAKVLGAWNLHLWSTDKTSVRAFVMYSSVASLFGSVGQSNYAAGNAFLDALARDREQKGLPGLSINWPLWLGDGMASGIEGDILSKMTDSGYFGIDADKGVELLALFGRISDHIRSLCRSKSILLYT